MYVSRVHIDSPIPHKLPLNLLMYSVVQEAVAVLKNQYYSPDTLVVRKMVATKVLDSKFFSLSAI